MHDASGKTTSYPEGTGCLCPEGKTRLFFTAAPSQLPMPTSPISPQVTQYPANSSWKIMAPRSRDAVFMMTDSITSA